MAICNPLYVHNLHGADAIAARYALYISIWYSNTGIVRPCGTVSPYIGRRIGRGGAMV